MTILEDATASITVDGKKPHACTDHNGLARFTALPKGDAEITVPLAGFQNWRKTHLITGSVDSRVEATQKVGPVGGGHIVEPHKSPIKGKLR